MIQLADVVTLPAWLLVVAALAFLVLAVWGMKIGRALEARNHPVLAKIFVEGHELAKREAIPLEAALQKVAAEHGYEDHGLIKATVDYLVSD